MAARNIWRSNCLIYRSVEQTDETFLLSLNQNGSENFQNASHNLPVPQGPRSATQLREFLQTCLLGCIVCLPPSEPTTGTDAPKETSAESNSGIGNQNNENKKTNNQNTNNTPPQPIPIGMISLVATDAAHSHHRHTHLSISILSTQQKKGYGSEAILWALEFAFRHANLHRVGIEAFAWNEGAWKLYQRLGFVMEGRVRECLWYDGRWCEEVHLGMLAGEWWERYGSQSGKNMEKRVV